jgi:hypothetical protein
MKNTSTFLLGLGALLLVAAPAQALSLLQHGIQ